MTEQFFFFLATEHETSSISSNVNLTVFGFRPLGTKKDEYSFALL